MTTLNNVRGFGLTVIAASLAAGFGSAHAAHGEEFDSFEESVIYHSRPESIVRFGLGYLNEDAARFGQFTGLEDMGLYAIGEVRFVKRDDDTGTWMRLDGRNLGLSSRSLRFEHEAQGNWRYIIDYRKSPRYLPYTVNTGLAGIGSTEQVINGVPMRDVNLKTVRESVGLAGEKILGHGFDLKVNFKHETKKGDRLFGRHGVHFLAEPIDFEMRQVDVVLGYTGERLQMSGGYYGSFFKNADKALTAGPGGVSPIALSPDNQAHQFHLTGGYSFTPTTRGNFKLSRSVATQRDSFYGDSLSGRSNLGGKVVTMLAQAGISARPSSDLTLRANVKYEDRDDKTPVVQYVSSVSGTRDGFNHPRDFRQLKGTAEASYRLPENFRITGGVEYDKRTRNSQEIRSVSFRRNTEELSYRVALSRSLGETLNGSIAYVRSERDGSRFEFNRRVDDTDGSNLIAPLHLADRDRDTVRLRLDWMPIEPLSLQFLADISYDKYGGRELGPHKRRAHFLSVDASYAISRDWQGHAWVTRDTSRAVNRTRAGAANDGTGGTPWQAALRQSGDAVGLGLRGRATEKLEFGADFQYSRDRSTYRLSGPTNPDDLPRVKYSLASLKLSAKYAMQRDLALRFDVIHDRWRTNDWLWTDWTYSDGTTVNQDRKQNATFVGVSVQYNWR